MQFMKVNVFITVDTEHSIGGAFRDPNLKPVGNDRRIFGRIGDKEYGIPLIMDIADRYGIPLTFFVEVLNKYYFGEEESRTVCKYIIDRGHDVQLHLHPNYLNFTLPDPRQMKFSDLIGTYSLSKQVELIEEGKSILVKNGVPEPIAFRAGCFGANQDTLRALKETGFIIDSSYNTAYLGSPCLLDDIRINDLTYLEGIYEFPITNFVESSKLRSKRFMPLDINGVSFQETKTVLNHARYNGPQNITIILHSFNFVKAYNVQYSRTKPRRHVIKRFDNLCAFLDENNDVFKTKTFGSLDKKQLTKMSLHSSNTFSRVPAKLSLMRGLEQLKDNWL